MLEFSRVYSRNREAGLHFSKETLKKREIIQIYYYEVRNISKPNAVFFLIIGKNCPVFNY